MELSPYLRFDGRCEEAFRLYQRLTGGTLEALVKYRESPVAGEVPPEWQDRVFHARLVFGGQVLMGADSRPGEYVEPRGIQVSLEVGGPEVAERIFRGLADGGTVDVPLQETPWAHRFGMVTDAYSIPWIVNCDRESYS